MNVNAYMAEMKRQVYDKFQAEFFRVFHIPLQRYWSNLLGFDIIAFDDFLHTPTGLSLKERVERQYGEEALHLIEAILAEEGKVAEQDEANKI